MLTAVLPSRAQAGKTYRTGVFDYSPVSPQHPKDSA